MVYIFQGGKFHRNYGIHNWEVYYTPEDIDDYLRRNLFGRTVDNKQYRIYALNKIWVFDKFDHIETRVTIHASLCIIVIALFDHNDMFVSHSIDMVDTVHDDIYCHKDEYHMNWFFRKFFHMLELDQCTEYE